MKFNMTNELALLLMMSATSAQVITPTVGRDILDRVYTDFRILAKATSFDNDPPSGSPDDFDEWLVREVRFFKPGSCTDNHLIQPLDGPAYNSPSDDDPNTNDLLDDTVITAIGPSPLGENYWVGYSTATASKLGCMRVSQTANQFMRNIEVQVIRDNDSWQTLYNITDIDATGSNTFHLLSSWPSDVPSITPSISGVPSNMPSDQPSVLPSDEPSVLVSIIADKTNT